MVIRSAPKYRRNSEIVEPRTKLTCHAEERAAKVAGYLEGHWGDHKRVWTMAELLKAIEQWGGHMTVALQWPP